MPFKVNPTTGKLDYYEISVASDTNLTYTPSPTNGVINSDTGTDATIPLADATNAGLFSAAEKTKLGIALIAVGVDYRGAYNNGDGTYGIGTVVLYNNYLYEKISNPGNPGYPPSGPDWQLFEPLIGSPAFDLWIKNVVVDNKLTKTSELINDGDNGTSHFISLQDLPSNLTLYATNVASGISTYSKIVTAITDVDYNATAVDIPTGEITGANQFIAALVTPANIIIGNPGIFTMSTIGNIRRISGTGTATFYYEVYKRTSAGVETLIVTSANTLAVDNPVYSEFQAAALFNNGVFVATDRIVLKFYGTRIPTGSNPSYEFQFGGAVPVRTTLPIPLTVVPSSAFVGYANEIHVSAGSGNDTTGTGALLFPYATITKALSVASGGLIIVHPGTYTESPTSNVVVTIISVNDNASKTIINGTLTIAAATRVGGIRISNLVITTSGTTYIDDCDITTSFLKSGSGFVQIDNTTLQCSSGSSITGAGLVTINGDYLYPLVVNNIAANVIVKISNSFVAPVVLAGTLSIVDSVIMSATPTGNAITSSAGTIVTLSNSQILVPTLDNVARVNLQGFYSIFNVVYDKPNSTLAATSGTGGSTNSIDYFQYINADKFIKQGGTSSQFLKADGSVDTTTYQASLGYTPEDQANKSTNTSLGTSNTLYPTQNAVKVYTDSILGNANALVYKGVIDCSINPNYPAGNAGELYLVSVAGKIGGASGETVEVGDMIICNTDGTVSGDQAAVGVYWNIIQKNISGAVSGPASSVNNNVAFFDGVTGKLIKDSGLALSGTNTGNQTLAHTSDATTHTATLSATGGSIKLAEGSGITLTTTGTVSNGIVTIATTNSGTVTSVTGTTPIVSSGGATPAISIPQATTSVDGYLTAANWTTFNSKQAALTSGTNIKTVNGSSILGSGNLIANNSYLGNTLSMTYQTPDTIGQFVVNFDSAALVTQFTIWTGDTDYYNPWLSKLEGNSSYVLQIGSLQGIYGLYLVTAKTLDVGNAFYNYTLTLIKASGTFVFGDSYSISFTKVSLGLALTTTGTSGAATISGSTLNIPQYTGGTGSFDYGLSYAMASQNILL